MKPFVKAGDLTATIHAAIQAAGAYAPMWMVENWIMQAKSARRFGLDIGWAGYRIDPTETAATFTAELEAIERGDVVRTCEDCGCPIVPNWYAGEGAAMPNYYCTPCNAVRWQAYLATLQPMRPARSETWGT